MLRTINYTLSPTESRPKDLQFAGVQGENNATVCVFTPDTAFATALAEVAGEYDRLMVRVDCIDGLNRPIIGTPETYTSGAVTFPLSAEVTEAGGTLKIVLCFSGETVGEEPTVLYTFPVQLYFENFPLHEDLTARENLNKAVLTCQHLRAETYSIAASVTSAMSELRLIAAQVDQDKTTCEESADTCENAVVITTNQKDACELVAAHVNSVSATVDANAAAALSAQQQATVAASNAIRSAGEAYTSANLATTAANGAGRSCDEAAASATAAATSATAAAGSASAAYSSASAATASVIAATGSASAASSAASAAADSATAAETASTAAAASAASAEASLDEILAVVGNINAVLATVVNG